MPLCTHVEGGPATDNGSSGGQAGHMKLVNGTADHPYRLVTPAGSREGLTGAPGVGLGQFGLNGTFNGTVLDGDTKREPWISINELQMIKVVVLVVVVGILLLSTCRVVFRTFSRYTGRKGDGD